MSIDSFSVIRVANLSLYQLHVIIQKNQLGSHETLAHKSAAHMNVLAISLRFFAFISVWSFGMRSSLACSTMAAKALLVLFGKVDKFFVGFGRARRIDKDMVKGSRVKSKSKIL